MNERWSPERVTALAPDSASDVAGRRLATPVPWSGIGWAHPLLWGACQGSGTTPYEVAIDVSGPTYACSCPSRKFPCKHVLGLLYLWSEGRIDEGGSISRFALHWSTRRERAESAEEPKPLPTKTAEQIAAAAARAAQREERVTDGLAELDRWLADQVTAGLAHTRPGTVANVAARMVDAQAPGVAGRLRDLDRASTVGGDRGRRAGLDDTLSEYGLLHLLARGWTQPDLSDDLRATIRAHIGFTIPKESVLATPPVADRWAVIGMRDSDEEQVSTRRVWLYGNRTGRFALVLFFTPHGMTADASLVPGSAVDAELHYYPGGPQLRALLGQTQTMLPTARIEVAAGTVAEAVATWRGALAQDPWLTSYPVCLSGRPDLTPEPVLVDSTGEGLRLLGDAVIALMARTGGDPATVFGELTPRGLLPTAMNTADGLVVL